MPDEYNDDPGSAQAPADDSPPPAFRAFDEFAAIGDLITAATSHVGPLPVVGWTDDDDFHDGSDPPLEDITKNPAYLGDFSDERLTRMAAAATASSLSIFAKRNIVVSDENKFLFQPEPPATTEKVEDDAPETAKKADDMAEEETGGNTAPEIDHGTQRLPSLRSMFDITHDVDAELSWQADGMTPHGGVVLFAGGKSAGKSTLARQYALAVARGEPFLGREVEQGPVVVASLEDPKGVSSEHWRQLGLREADPIFGWDGPLPDDPASWLHGVHQEVHPALVLIDSFGRWTRGKAALNSYDEIIAITEDVLTFCRATHCVVAFTHHIRKGGGDDVSETVSGSMAIIGLCDTTLHLMRNGDGSRSIQTTQRAGEDMETTALVFDAGRITLGGVVWKTRAEEAEARVMLHIPADGTWTTNQEVLRKCGGHKQAIVRALQNLVKAGMIDAQGLGTKRAPKEFRLRAVDGF